MFYVINLLRRPDRKNEFLNKWDELKIDDELKFIEACDGTKEFIDLKTYTENNDYGNNPRIAATIESHYRTWVKIANSDEEFGVVLEDDIYFHPEFNKHWKNIKNQLLLRKTQEIIYLGMGDCLPIHTNPPSLSLLKAQEKSHIIKGSLEQKVFGKINTNSSYIFDWYGAFSYILKKDTAKTLVRLANLKGINKAVDVWLKEIYIKKLVTVPLLTYHAPFDNNVYDSDTWGISKPVDNFKLEKTNYSTAFLITSINNTECLKKCMDNIYDKADHKNNLMFAIMIDDKDKETKNMLDSIRDKYSICILTTNNLHNYKDNMNKVWSCYFKAADFIVPWEDSKHFITYGWDTWLFKYYEMFNKPYYACFQFRSNMERDSNRLNREKTGSANSVWDFSTPFLTKELLIITGYLTCSSNIYEYLRYLCYMSKITIFIREIEAMNTERDCYPTMKDFNIDEFYNSKSIKNILSKNIYKITNSNNWKPCGLWVNIPNNWESTDTIGESKLEFENQKF